MQRIIRLLAAAALGVGAANAHSYVSAFVVNGVQYGGFHPMNHPAENPDILAAWETSVMDDGWVGVNDYGKPDFICHRDATSGNGNVPLDPGDTISIQWNGWPQGHRGPVLTYLAFCGDEPDACMNANKTQLEFFQIDAVGLIDPVERLHTHDTPPGTWATDMLINSNHSYTVQIPRILSPGNYVMRQEIIALHYALIPGEGPQHYPQCINILLSGDGTAMPEGILATELYGITEDSEGLMYDVEQDAPFPPYPIPGPELISGALPSATQSVVVVTATTTALEALATA